MTDVVILFIGLAVFALIHILSYKISTIKIEIICKEKELATIDALMMQLSSKEQTKTVAANK